MADRLLQDPRTDFRRGSDEMKHPLQYACARGHLPVVEVFDSLGLLEFEHEDLLQDTALEYGQYAVYSYLQNSFLGRRTLDELSPKGKVEKLWQEFLRADEDRNGWLDMAELRPLAARLGTGLSEPELGEAMRALDTDGDRRIDFEELVSFWLATEDGIDPAVVQAAAEIVQRDKRAQKQASGESSVEDSLLARSGSFSAGIRFDTTYG